MSFGIQPDFEFIAGGLAGDQRQQYEKVDDVEDKEGLAPGGGYLTRVRSQTEPVPTQSVQKFSSTVNMAPSIDEEYKMAEQAWLKNQEKLPGKACRALWALQNQATVGDCNTKKPSGVFNGNAKEQWRLWNELQGISMEDAKLMFIERLRKEKVPF